MPDQAHSLAPGGWSCGSARSSPRAADRCARPDPVGYINYGADGRFYTLVVSRNRPGPASLPPSTDEKIRLFDSMLAYTGTYTLDDEKAVHHVDASWNQAWTGTDQVRFYKLDGDRLTITGAPAKDPHTGQDTIYRIEFDRVLSSP